MKSFKLAAVAFFALLSFVVADLSFRLDGSVKPEAYDITITPYLLTEDGARQFTFDGEVLITLHAVVPQVSEITLHKDYIDVLEVALYDNSAILVQAVGQQDLAYESATDKLTVRLQTALHVNANYTLLLKYQGQIRNGVAGLFRVNYTDAAGNQKWIGVTQSQRIDARTIFPCFDEPALKAKFKMHISRPKQYNSIFNTRLMGSEAIAGNRYLDHFEESPPMSTYLVAFIVSDFKARGNTDFSVITRPDYYNKTAFSYDVGVKTLKAYDEYTKLPYKELGISIMQKAGSPLFPHNGMENWGLVIYKDAVLVHEPGYTDGWANKEYTITILVHETAHMWFGNSVTFSWWSYFWLNEAFARYYQYFLAHELYPEYQLDQQFVVNQVHLIFGIDALNSTQPMTSLEGNVQTPSQIASKFSSIAYAKGAAVVRMICHCMGNANFDTAVRAYLKENHLGSTRPADLFVHLKQHWPESPTVDLDEFFHDWTEQVGYPMLIVNISAEANEITIQQKRFLLEPTDGSDANLRYTMPITYTTDSEGDFKDLKPRFYFKINGQYTIRFNKVVEWIIFNRQQAYYYRVLYDAPLLGKIKKALLAPNYSGIHVANRAQLVDDLFNYARVGLVAYDAVFEFIEYLEEETEYLPWYAAFAGLQRVAQHLTVPQQKDLGKFIEDISKKVYEKLGFHSPTDTVLDVYNRNKVIGWLCRYKHAGCNKEAQRILSQTMKDSVKPLPDFRETVYCSAVREAEFTYYQALQSWHDDENLPSEQQLLLRAMGCTRHFAEYHYARILTDKIPQEHKQTALTPLYTQNAENVTPVFEMVTDTIDRLADALGSWLNAANVVSGIANHFTTRKQQRMLEDFIADKGDLFGTSVVTLHTAVDNVKKNLNWAESRLGSLVEYLAKRNGAAAVRGLSYALVLLLGVAYYFI